LLRISESEKGQEMTQHTTLFINLNNIVYRPIHIFTLCLWYET